MGTISMHNVLDINEPVSAVHSVATPTTGHVGYNYSGEVRPQVWSAILTVGNLFEVLHAPLALGAKWTDHDDREHHHQVIFDHGVWKDSFGGRRDVSRKKTTLDHASGYTIDGMAGQSFDYPRGIQVHYSVRGFGSRSVRCG